MSITAYQINNGMPTPISDRHMYNLLSGGQCGVISGMELTKNGNQITVGDGWGIINGCIFRVKSEVITIPLSSGTTNGRLFIRLVTTSDDPIKFMTHEGSTLPALIQETGDNFTYDMELCRYTLNGTTITSELDTSYRPTAEVDFSNIINMLHGAVLTGTSSNKTLEMSLNNSHTILTIRYE